jgi:MEMO1 family protein
MKNTALFILVLSGLVCSGISMQETKTRQPVDPVGFATLNWQMDSVVSRVGRIQGDRLLSAWKGLGIDSTTSWKTVICPHDDYAYAGWLYPAVLTHVKAGKIILFGVAHKAKKYGVEDRLVFGDYDQWSAPYGSVRVSSLQQKILRLLPPGDFLVHDSLQQAEHSLEAMVPWLQHFNREVEIVPILVPYMSFRTMEMLLGHFATALARVMKENNLSWGADVAIVISNDAVHYGDEEWGGQNYSPYGCDSAGYGKALAHEYEIISGCLAGSIDRIKIRRFTGYTVQDTNYRAYKWTWCGRYSVPFGLLVTSHLQQELHPAPVLGTLVGYSNSIMQSPIAVSDLGMGVTAIANMHHWVGYAAIGYR